MFLLIFHTIMKNRSKTSIVTTGAVVVVLLIGLALWLFFSQEGKDIVKRYFGSGVSSEIGKEVDSKSSDNNFITEESSQVGIVGGEYINDEYGVSFSYNPVLAFETREYFVATAESFLPRYLVEFFDPEDHVPVITVEIFNSEEGLSDFISSYANHSSLLQEVEDVSLSDSQTAKKLTSGGKDYYFLLSSQGNIIVIIGASQPEIETVLSSFSA